MLPVISPRDARAWRVTTVPAYNVRAQWRASGRARSLFKPARMGSHQSSVSALKSKVEGGEAGQRGRVARCSSARRRAAAKLEDYCYYYYYYCYCYCYYYYHSD